MLSDQYKRELAQLTKDAGKIRSDIGAEETKASRARRDAGQKRQSASKATSPSMRAMYERQAESEDRKVADAEKKIGTLHDKLSALLSRQQNKEQMLRNAERSEAAARDRAEEARKRKEKTERDAKDRVDKQRRREEVAHAREVARLKQPIVRHIVVRPPEPEKLRVLYLTASPATPNLPDLRVDAEVNNVLKSLRGAKYRDLIDLRHRPAATVEDLINGLNDHRPHVVHFSGHAQGGLLFDDANLSVPGDLLVSYDAVARILGATDHPPTLVVLNACRTQEAAATMLTIAPVVIATDDTVGDASAAIFAAQFYGAVAAAQSIGDAVAQAREMIAMALPGERDAVVVLAADGVDPDTVVLVQPLDQR